MQLEDLVGIHWFSGVDYINRNKDQDDYRQVINFKLDGSIYTAIEDDNDGYRSAMAEIIKTGPHMSFKDGKTIFVFPKLENEFKRIKVMCLMRIGRYGYDCDILDIYDVKNGKLVLSVGTDNTDDYYPSFVSSFIPENMHINEGKENG